MHNIEQLEGHFEFYQSLNEYYHECDEEYKEYIDSVNEQVEALLVDNLHDVAFVRKCMAYFPHLYKKLPHYLKIDFDVALTAVTQDRKCFSFLSQEVKDSRKFREALFFAASGLLDVDFTADDEEQVNQLLEKISVSEYYFKYASESLRMDRNFCCRAADLNGMILHFLPVGFYEDEEVTRTALMQNGIALKYAHPMFQANLSMVLLAVQQNDFAIRYAHPSLFMEKELHFIWEKPQWAEFKRRELEMMAKGYVKYMGMWS